LSSAKLARLVPQPEGSTPEEMVHLSSFVFLTDGAGKLLLMKRARPERWAGKWCLPGSVLFYGEDPAVGAGRVVKEQLGATATEMKLLGVDSYGDKHWDICFVFHAQIQGIGQLGADFEKAEYFDLAALPPELRDDHREVIEMSKTRKRL
jgi:ADP-ribose pyrophosphatase YjhB (NUDIX family)